MEKDRQPRIKSYNTILLRTQEEAEAWSAAHPEVPVKVVPAPSLESMNVIKEEPTILLDESVEKPVSIPTEQFPTL